MSAAIRGWLSLMLLLFAGMAGAQPAVDQYYRLGVGDTVEIRVYGEDDLTVKTRLGDSGTISYPFLGEINARGLSVSDLEQLIVKGLKGTYLIDPVISVNIVEYRPFFLNGEVNKPGAIPFQPGITLRKAIAIAGGFTERANRSAGDVLRSPATKSTAIGLDDQVRPGDIITIKQSFF